MRSLQVIQGSRIQPQVKGKNFYEAAVLPHRDLVEAVPAIAQFAFDAKTFDELVAEDATECSAPVVRGGAADEKEWISLKYALLSEPSRKERSAPRPM